LLPHSGDGAFYEKIKKKALATLQPISVPLTSSTPANMSATHMPATHTPATHMSIDWTQDTDTIAQQYVLNELEISDAIQAMPTVLQYYDAYWQWRRELEWVRRNSSYTQRVIADAYHEFMHTKQTYNTLMSQCAKWRSCIVEAQQLLNTISTRVQDLVAVHSHDDDTDMLLINQLAIFGRQCRTRAVNLSSVSAFYNTLPDQIVDSLPRVDPLPVVPTLLQADDSAPFTSNMHSWLQLLREPDVGGGIEKTWTVGEL